MQRPYDPTKPGSFYTIGPDNPDCYVIFLHGSSRNAEWMRKAATRLAKNIPGAQVIVPNGYVDNFDPEVTGFRKAESPGQKFDWQFFSDEQYDRYCENWMEDDGIYNATFNYADTSKPIHLVGFSAGAYGVHKAFNKCPSAFASLTMIGYHANKYVNDMIIEKAKENPENIAPIMVGFGAFDPLLLFNQQAKTSKVLSKLTPKRVFNFAGRHQWMQEHNETLNDMEQAGFPVTRKTMPFSTHNLTAEVTHEIANFIKSVPARPSSLEDRPSADI